MRSKRQQLLKIGSLIRYHNRPWRVGMVGNLNGERYYWLVRAMGEVAMVPAFLLDKINR